MNARQSFKTEEPIFVENYDLIKNYHEMLDELMNAEVQAFELNFDESIEQAAEELERISSVQELDDILVQEKPALDPFSAVTRISNVSANEKNERPTVVVYFAEHAKARKMGSR